ncbi:NAD-dependent epimerase/dehydratase family protein [Microbacterium sp. USHLN272]|uniref:NAD-dependent epimerase/dehydratase family protein n=1 Tax=Microbacterium sp. USHLN272 TaxID=3081287 RepID=UPI003018E6D6
MRALILGARGAVGTVVRRDLERDGHRVTAASRAESDGARIDLRGDLAPLVALAADHDVVVNASGIERSDLASATGATPLVDISATGSYLEALRRTASGPVVLGAGLVPGLSTVLAASLGTRAGDDLDVLVMLGSGEHHGPAAVAWTAGLVGTDLHRPPEGGAVRNFRESVRAFGPDGRDRRYLRADFPDHVLLGGPEAPSIRSYLTLGSAMMTGALDLVGRMPSLRGALTAAPHVGTDAWHVVARNRRTGERNEASGHGQSDATGRLTALAAVRVVEAQPAGAVTMADLVPMADALAAATHATAPVHL